MIKINFLFLFTFFLNCGDRKFKTTHGAHIIFLLVVLVYTDEQPTLMILIILQEQQIILAFFIPFEN